MTSRTRKLIIIDKFLGLEIIEVISKQNHMRFWNIKAYKLSASFVDQSINGQRFTLDVNAIVLGAGQKTV